MIEQVPPNPSAQMSGHEYLDLKERMGWTYKQIARELGVSMNTSIRWGSQEVIPGSAARCLRLLAEEELE